MATFPQASNPYQPPPTHIAATGAAVQPGRRPGGLTAICVITLVLGGLGLIASLVGLAALAAQDQIQKTFAVKSQPGMPENFAKTQQEMQAKMQTVQKPYRGVSMGLLATNIVLASCLIVGGIMVLRFHPKGCSLLVGAFVVAIAFETARTIVGVAMQLDTAAVMSQTMVRMAEASPSSGGSGGVQAAETIAMITRIGVFVGMAFTVVFGLAKIIFYIIGFRYLRRPTIRALFPIPNP